MVASDQVRVAGANAVKPNDEIALSMLCAGQERFVIPNVAFLSQ